MSSVLFGYICRTYLWTVSHFKKNHSLCLCFISGQMHTDYCHFSSVAAILNVYITTGGKKICQSMGCILVGETFIQNQHEHDTELHTDIY